MTAVTLPVTAAGAGDANGKGAHVANAHNGHANGHAHDHHNGAVVTSSDSNGSTDLAVVAADVASKQDGQGMAVTAAGGAERGSKQRRPSLMGMAAGNAKHGMVLPFTPMAMAFSNICYSVNMPKDAPEWVFSAQWVVHVWARVR